MSEAKEIEGRAKAGYESGILAVSDIATLLSVIGSLENDALRWNESRDFFAGKCCTMQGVVEAARKVHRHEAENETCGLCAALIALDNPAHSAVTV